MATSPGNHGHLAPWPSSDAPLLYAAKSDFSCFKAASEDQSAASAILANCNVSIVLCTRDRDGGSILPTD